MLKCTDAEVIKTKVFELHALLVRSDDSHFDLRIQPVNAEEGPFTKRIRNHW